MSELNELYQEIILDHNKNPRNFNEIPKATHTAEGSNPLCGDKVKVFINVKDGKIVDISFLGSGCAISKASASLMTSAVKGKGIPRAKELFHKVHQMLTSKIDQPSELEALGDLSILSGIHEFPMRVKCASLPWHAMLSALDEEKT